MNNLLSNCGLLDPRISASDKDLPVIIELVFRLPVRAAFPFPEFPETEIELVFRLAGVVLISTLGTFFFQFSSPFFFSAANLEKMKKIIEKTKKSNSHTLIKNKD